LITEDELVTVYRGTVEPLYAYISCRTGSDQELTEDTVQETYMRALSYWRRKGMPTVPLAWLKTVARNLLISHYRRVNPLPLNESIIDLSNEHWNIEKRDNAALLYFGLSHLKKEHARLIEAFYFDEKSVRAIAEEQGLSERAVEGRLRRARQKLKKYLSRYSPAEGGSR
jgi:RNA polymerase sigma-70 factor (ECF subfamily)